MSKTMTKREAAIQRRKLAEKAGRVADMRDTNRRAAHLERIRLEEAEEDARRAAALAARRLPPTDLYKKYLRLCTLMSDTHSWLEFQDYEVAAATAARATMEQWLADPVQNARLEAAIAAGTTVKEWCSR